MSLFTRALALAFIVFSVASVSFAGPTTGSYKNNAGSRNYTLYTPTQLAKNPGLVVVLHGCFMTGDQMASGAMFNNYAEKKGFAVLYPEQTYVDNAWKCWNWFQPDNLKRGTGELSILADMTKYLVKKMKLDPTKVFVTGISAGGAMASNLLGCYSDVFAGGMIHSGLEYAAASSESEAHSIMKTGPTHGVDQGVTQALACSPTRKTLMPVIVVQGKADPFVGPINAERIAEFFGKLNANIFKSQGGAASQITTETGAITQENYNFSAETTATKFAGQTVINKVMVVGMGHGWSGGQPTAPYMEPRGVNATQIMVDTFFP